MIFYIYYWNVKVFCQLYALQLFLPVKISLYSFRIIRYSFLKHKQCAKYILQWARTGSGDVERCRQLTVKRTCRSVAKYFYRKYCYKTSHDNTVCTNRQKSVTSVCCDKEFSGHYFKVKTTDKLVLFLSLLNNKNISILYNRK